MNFKVMNRELTWTTCSSYQTPILPKLTIQFWKDTNKNKKMKHNSFKFENNNLFIIYLRSLNSKEMLIFLFIYFKIL